jgi:hypothetical protein
VRSRGVIVGRCYYHQMHGYALEVRYTPIRRRHEISRSDKNRMKRFNLLWIVVFLLARSAVMHAEDPVAGRAASEKGNEHSLKDQNISAYYNVERCRVEGVI